MTDHELELAACLRAVEMIPPSLVRDAAKTAGYGEVHKRWFAKCAEAYHQQTLARFDWQVNPVSRAICERATKWVEEACGS